MVKFMAEYLHLVADPTLKGMFESIGRSFELVKTSWSILMADKKLLVFPILSGIVTIAVILTFVLPLIVTGAFMSMSAMGPVLKYGSLFAFYVVSYFVVIFFNTALISLCQCTAERKGDVSKRGSFQRSKAPSRNHRMGNPFRNCRAWYLNLLQERAGFIGDIILSIIGGVWSLVTFFVVPVLVLEDKGVVDSLKGSVDLIKKTWGESIVGTAGMAIVFVIIGVVAGLGVLATMALGNMVVFGVALGLFLAFIVILAVIYSAMQGIFVTALYTYAKTGSVPSAFNNDLIQNAFAPKQPGTGNI